MAETTSAPSLQEWVLVPRQPTEAMLNAPLAPRSSITSARYESRRDLRPLIYRTMVDAAPPTTLTEAVAAARAETERYKTALKLAMGLVQRCVGEGITFEEDDPLPEMESWKVAEAIAETLGIDMNSAAYVDLFKGPLTPGGRTDG